MTKEIPRFKVKTKSQKADPLAQLAELKKKVQKLETAVAALNKKQP